ncbi:SMP-30/gluconolactonase/LRE family protein [Curtobacterium sp. VKM Ac-1393]|uniref:SMP-30/gluconolactonase/LRE family protein n=1 Tax=Curtobacterium sp. VKM Ac-1393 TaxID=2783814 RepID=UPI00188C72E8|nr:SMP-30/gluconolactonase/LRE family protein [Curtobacterium sp. VKM Ac-1393]MBF4609567.1 SMP-30/gluconolactonase/LRE family protein [Curtobacterium sp. VKM Ac-1393]
MHITLDSATDVVTDIRFPEGNRWHDGRLWYSDMHTGQVFSLDPASTAAPRMEATVDGQSSGLGWLADGRLIVSSMESRTVVAVDDVGDTSVFADLSGVESSLVNDLVVDAATGRTYIGAFGYDLYGGEELRPGPLYVIEQDGSFRLAAEGLVFPNSANVLPGTRTLVVSETWGGRLTAFDIEPDGSLTGRREWAALPGGVTPDGSTVDRDGAVWVCSVDTGEFLRVLEGGEVTDRIDAPGLCAIDCALGGEDGRTLYLATADSYDPATTAQTRAGRISAVRVAVPGW